MVPLKTIDPHPLHPIHLIPGLLLVWLLSASTLSSQTVLYWLDDELGTLQRSTADGLDRQVLVEDLEHPNSLVYSPASKSLFWTVSGSTFGAGRIEAAAIDGNNRRIVLSNLGDPHGIAIDASETYIYWTEYSENRGREARILRSRLGTATIELLVDGIHDSDGIVLDPPRGIVFSTRGTHALGEVWRARNDGSAAAVLVSFDAPDGPFGGVPFALAFGENAAEIYWTETWGGRIQVAQADGSNVRTLLEGLGAPRGFALDLPSGKMYWCEALEPRIRRADLNGWNAETILEFTSGSPQGLIVLPAGSIVGVDHNTLADAGLSVEMQLELHPNPAAESVTLSLDNVAPGSLTVAIIDALGREWPLYERREINTSIGKIQLQIKRLPEGACFVHVRNGLRSATRSLLVLR